MHPRLNISMNYHLGGAALFFGGFAYKITDYHSVWINIPASSDVKEMIRTYVIRQPILWITSKA